MKKLKVAAALFGPILALIFFQNCSGGFSSNKLAESSLAAVDVPLGTVNNPGGPVISKGLTDTLAFGGYGGSTIAIEVQDGAGVLYTWKIGTLTFETTVPELTTDRYGNLDVSVVAKAPSGAVSTSRAIYSISRFTRHQGKLYYYKATTNVFEPIANADMASLKLLSLNLAADANRIYKIRTGNAWGELAVAGALNAKPLNDYYTRIGNAVYYELTLMPTADGTTFTALGNAMLGKDSSKVFCIISEVAGADAATFTAPFKDAGNFAVDKNNIYSACAPAGTSAGFMVVVDDAANTDRFFRTNTGHFVLSNPSPQSNSSPGVFLLPFTPTVPANLKTISTGLGHLITDGLQEAFTNTQTISPVNIDTATFQSLHPVVVRDKNAVYVIDGSNFVPFANADPATFVRYDDVPSTINNGIGLFKDKNRMWAVYNFVRDLVGPLELTGLDIASVKFIGKGYATFVADNSGVLLLRYDAISGNILNAKLALPSPLTFKMVTQGYYIYNSSGLYYVGSRGTTATLVTGIPIGTPKELALPKVLSVGASLIEDGVVDSTVNATNLAPIANTKYFWQNGAFVYWLSSDAGAIQLTNRIANFRVIDPVKSLSYSTDGITIWYQSRAITSVDLATFVVDGDGTAHDKNRAYNGFTPVAAP